MSEDCNLIFVAGVSGVGKTNVIRQFVSHHPDYLHLEASQLIKQALNIQDSEAIRALPKEKIIENQSRLLKELDKYKCQYKKIILDGHLFIDNGQEYVPIPIETLQAIAPKKIIIMVGEAQDVVSHISHDTRRVRPKKSTVDIDRAQNFLKRIAEEYCKKLDIKLHVMDYQAHEQFDQLVAGYV